MADYDYSSGGGDYDSGGAEESEGAEGSEKQDEALLKMFDRDADGKVSKEEMEMGPIKSDQSQAPPTNL